MKFVHTYMYYQLDEGFPLDISPSMLLLHTFKLYSVGFMAGEVAVRVQCFTTVWIHSRGERLLCFLMISIPSLTTQM